MHIILIDCKPQKIQMRSFEKRKGNTDLKFKFQNKQKKLATNIVISNKLWN
jgi:hypothetical protein